MWKTITNKMSFNYVEPSKANIYRKRKYTLKGEAE